jgi:putative tricarboxylic transport membrane protein
MKRREFSLAVAAAAVTTQFGASHWAHAQSVGTLKMMIPANPGGGWDQTGRNLAAAMQAAKLVQSVQFENKGGAAGTPGLAQFVNSAKGDPNAVMIGGMVMVGGIILNKSPVDLTMVTPIARLTSEYEVIVVPAASPHKTLDDLVKAFKANPGAVSWGGGSAGGTDHILVGLIAKAVGADVAKINYVPFKGGGEAIAAIVGGHVTAGVSGVGEFAEQIKGAACARWRCRRPTASTAFRR